MKFSFASVPNAANKRWFVEYGGKAKYDRGFSSPEEAEEWIVDGIAAGKVAWREGWDFRIKGCKYDCRIVNRKGEYPWP